MSATASEARRTPVLDRRVAPRFLPWACDMTVRPLQDRSIPHYTSGTPLKSVTLLDLAESGARILFQGLVDIGRPVDVTLRVLPDGKPIQGRGRVAWCRPHPEMPGYSVAGVKFDPWAPALIRVVQGFQARLVEA